VCKKEKIAKLEKENAELKKKIKTPAGLFILSWTLIALFAIYLLFHFGILGVK